MVNRLLRKPVLLSGGVALLLATGLSGGSAGSGVAAPSTRPASREAVAKILLAHQRDRFATPALTRALQITAGLQQSPGRIEQGSDAGASAARTSAGPSIAAPPRSGLANSRVNDPAADRYQVDQTTQSETTVAVSGSNVAVGFNDSQRALFTLTSGFDFSGYGYSTDGGKTFTDGGVLPNKPSFVNFGDPWLTSDRAGRMYYATLAFGGDAGNLEIGVAVSDDGGKTWSEPTIASPNDPTSLYFGDKEAITAGRDPEVDGRDNLYVAWDDFVATSTGEAFTGLPVSTSTDGAKTWKITTAGRGDGDEIQPALSVDAKGLHLAYYQRNPDNTLDLVLSDSTDRGTHFRAARVTNRSFPGVQNLPQFDPQVAQGYLGDYIANVSDGTNLYLAWGDNRNKVTDFMWPEGRNDPDVYFARR